MTLLYWEWHLIPRWLLRRIVAPFPEQLPNVLASWGTPGKYFMILLLLLLIGVGCARPGESENTLLVQWPQPHTTNPWKEEKDKTVGDRKERADYANREALALLLKHASPTPSNTGSLRSFQEEHREGHKASAVLRSPTTRRRERVPMSNQSTTSNTRRHIRQRHCTA